WGGGGWRGRGGGVVMAGGLGDRHAPGFSLGDRGRGRLGRSNSIGPVEIVDGACEFRLRRSLRREALALAAATVAPPAPPSAAPASALALAMCLCRPFGAATAVAGLVGLARWSEIMLARCGSEVRGLCWRDLVALVLERLAAFAAAAAAPPPAPSAALPLLARGLRLLARGLRALLLLAFGSVFGFGRLFVLVVAFVLVLLD